MQVPRTRRGTKKGREAVSYAGTQGISGSWVGVADVLCVREREKDSVGCCPSDMVRHFFSCAPDVAGAPVHWVLFISVSRLFPVSFDWLGEGLSCMHW